MLEATRTENVLVLRWRAGEVRRAMVFSGAAFLVALVVIYIGAVAGLATHPRASIACGIVGIAAMLASALAVGIAYYTDKSVQLNGDLLRLDASTNQLITLVGGAGQRVQLMHLIYKRGRVRFPRDVAGTMVAQVVAVVSNASGEVLEIPLALVARSLRQSVFLKKYAACVRDDGRMPELRQVDVTPFTVLLAEFPGRHDRSGLACALSKTGSDTSSASCRHVRRGEDVGHERINTGAGEVDAGSDLPPKSWSRGSDSGVGG